MLTRWDMLHAGQVADAVSNDTALDLAADDVLEFQRFLQGNSLLQIHGPAAVARFTRERQHGREQSWLSYLLHHYLYFRIPLVRPDAFLVRTLPLIARVLFTRTFFILTVIAGLTGVFLVTRQWDSFRHTFLHFFTLEGAALAALTLMGAKLLHELGHAYAARYFGARVATMGVAFIVMWPVLYTDSTGAWRLASRRQRLTIGAAGMITETAIAAWATLAWSFLPDGMLRSAAFTMATTIWVMTLAVNLNPLMRFDGYFLLSDALNVPNLQHRAFALARWQLREWLFDLHDAPPEPVIGWRRRSLLLYAFSVWIYRFFLFLGIAVLVYHKAFKLLGIALFAVEIGVFIVRPMYRELVTWQQRLKQTGGKRWNRRTSITLGIAALLLLMAVIPWRSRISAPAIVQSARSESIVTAVAGQLVQTHVVPGQHVKAGAPLFELVNPELDHEFNATQARVDLLGWQMSFHAMRRDTGADVPVARGELQAAQQRLTVLAQQRQALTIVAPFDGVIADMPAARPGAEWVSEGEWLATVTQPDDIDVLAYVTEEDVHRLQAGTTARFIAETRATGALALTLADVSATASRRLSAAPELASVNGGAIAAVRPTAEQMRNAQDPDAQSWIPEQAVYLVRLRPSHDADTQAAIHGMGRQVLRGTVMLQGERESVLHREWTRVAAVFLRESGF